MEEDGRARDHPRVGAARQLSTPSLEALAAAHGVSTEYEDAYRHWRLAPESSVRAALRVMGVPCESDDDVESSLREAEDAPWRRIVPDCTVVRASGHATLTVRLPPAAEVSARVRTEGGDIVPLDGTLRRTGNGARLRDGTERAEARVDLPDDVPLGYHHIEIEAEVPAPAPGAGHLIVVPDRCPDPTALGTTWGWMVQLYALRSEASWGMGDLADLRSLTEWTGQEGGDFVLINPLHAAAPTLPQEDSPYYPSSRRFINPLYLAVEEIPEVQSLGGALAGRLDALGRELRAANAADRIDRDAVFAAKHQALGAAFARISPARAEALAAFRRREGRALEDFAIFCTLAEEHGVPFQRWPAELRHPGSSSVASVRAARSERVAYHAWLQFLCDEQLASAQDAGLGAGARLGVVHDLAVGVDRGGADAWALQEALGLGVSVGAPPDRFNQQGQNWEQPPLLPHRLRREGYAPVREMLRPVLRHAGGVRIDHVLGMFRLFWIPDGESPAAGTYVRYPADELLGVVALEAARADAVVIGEDLGTVEEGVREKLEAWSVLSSSVLYFEQDEKDADALRPAEKYPAGALASVTTHDLPTAAGWWQDADVALRAALGLLDPATPEEVARAAKRTERERMEHLLAAAGLLAPDATIQERVRAMYAFLARTPSLLLAVNLPDVVSDLRQPNVPGTVDEYPNWRLPIAEPREDGHEPLTIEALRTHPGVAEMLTTLRTEGRGRLREPSA